MVHPLPTAVTVSPQCTVIELGTLGQTDRQTDGRTNGWIAALLNAPYRRRGHSNRPIIVVTLFSINKKHLKNVGPIRHCEPPHAACLTLPFTRCRYCRTPPAHRCPQQHQRQQRQQRQRVTEETAMVPWNGPNYLRPQNHVAPNNAGDRLDVVLTSQY